MTTNHTLDLNTGLTQVLSDGTTDYLYGNGRIAQVNTSAEYFPSTSSGRCLGDALGSVRQMVDSTGEVTFARGYDPGVYPEERRRSVVTYTTGHPKPSLASRANNMGIPHSCFTCVRGIIVPPMDASPPAIREWGCEPSLVLESSNGQRSQPWRAAHRLKEMGELTLFFDLCTEADYI